MDSSPITDLEQGIIVKIGAARYPPATASKRFARDLASGHIKVLTPRGRRFMAYIAHRFRKQYHLTDVEIDWVNRWIREPHSIPEQKELPLLQPESKDQLTIQEVYGTITV